LGGSSVKALDQPCARLLFLPIRPEVWPWRMRVIEYRSDITDLAPEQIQGFFVGWQHPFPPETHLRMLAGSDLAQVAIDADTGRVVGFIAALTDNVQGAFITLL